MEESSTRFSLLNGRGLAEAATSRGGQLRPSDEAKHPNLPLTEDGPASAASSKVAKRHAAVQATHLAPLPVLISPQPAAAAVELLMPSSPKGSSRGSSRPVGKSMLWVGGLLSRAVWSVRVVCTSPLLRSHLYLPLASVRPPTTVCA